MTRLAPTVVVVCLLAATAVAFAVTERLKLKESPILSTRIDELVSPVCNACPPGAREARIAFRLRREDELTLAIVDADGDVVRDDLVSGRFRPMFLRFAWDGRDDSGRIVPDGLYRVRVRLADEDRTLEFPNAIRVDSTAPEVEHVEVRPTVISPDGDGRRDRVKVRYSFSEPAYAMLYVDGKRRPRDDASLRPGRRGPEALGKGPGEALDSGLLPPRAGQTRPLRAHRDGERARRTRPPPRPPRLGSRSARGLGKGSGVVIAELT